ncbi:MAG: hypothetical protein M5U16_01420 [Hyphomicrobium sp.]|nr:hypothetical protein [Hyphomicrobium sp.]
MRLVEDSRYKGPHIKAENPGERLRAGEKVVRILAEQRRMQTTGVQETRRRDAQQPRRGCGVGAYPLRIGCEQRGWRRMMSAKRRSSTAPSDRAAKTLRKRVKIWPMGQQMRGKDGVRRRSEALRLHHGAPAFSRSI